MPITDAETGRPKALPGLYCGKSLAALGICAVGKARKTSSLTALRNGPSSVSAVDRRPASGGGLGPRHDLVGEDRHEGDLRAVLLLEVGDDRLAMRRLPRAAVGVDDELPGLRARRPSPEG